MTKLQILHEMKKQAFEEWQDEQDLSKRIKIQLYMEELSRDMEKEQSYQDSIKKFEVLRRVR